MVTMQHQYNKYLVYHYTADSFSKLRIYTVFQSFPYRDVASDDFLCLTFKVTMVIQSREFRLAPPHAQIIRKVAAQFLTTKIRQILTIRT